MILLFKPVLSLLLVFFGVTDYQFAPDRSLNEVSLQIIDLRETNKAMTFAATTSYALYDGTQLSIYAENKNSACEKVIIQTRLPIDTSSSNQLEGEIAIKHNGIWYSHPISKEVLITSSKLDSETRELSGSFHFEAFSIDSQTINITEGKFHVRY